MGVEMTFLHRLARIERPAEIVRGKPENPTGLTNFKSDNRTWRAAGRRGGQHRRSAGQRGRTARFDRRRGHDPGHQAPGASGWPSMAFRVMHCSQAGHGARREGAHMSALPHAGLGVKSYA
jgi:hypothetical protein